MARDPIDLTATGGGYFRVRVNGVEVSRHAAEREAAERATEEAQRDPTAVVEYDHDYRVRVEVPAAYSPERRSPGERRTFQDTGLSRRRLGPRRGPEVSVVQLGARKRVAAPAPPAPPPPVADRLGVTTEPSGAVNDVAFTQQPVIQIRDTSNAPVSEAGVTVTASKSAGTGTIGGTLTAVTNGSGVATFTNLKITGTGSHTLAFAADGLTATASIAFDVAAAPGAGTTIDAEVWRFDGNTGSVLVSSGFPLKPGQVTSANLDEVRVYVDTGGGLVEQAVALSPVYGAFPDGSYRSLGIQFQCTLADGVPLTAEVRLDAGARGTVDIAWTEPTLAGVVNNKAVIAPTSAAHKCGTLVTLVPLLPQASHVASNPTTFFDTTISGTPWQGSYQKYADWVSQLSAGIGTNKPAVSTYPYTQGFFAMWCMATGATARTYYQHGYNQGVADSYGYFAPGSGASGNKYAKCNPEGLTGNGEGLPNEPNSGVHEGWLATYWLTSWKQPWRCLCHWSSWKQNGTTTYAASKALFLDSYYLHRYNMQLGALTAFAAYVGEATMQVSGAYGAGRNPARLWATELPWILDALEEYIYTTANSAAYLDGIVGQRPTAADAGSAGAFPTFQLSATARALIFYYDHIAPDSRIPGWLQTIADFVIAQAVDRTTFYGLSYLHDPTPTAGETGPYELPFHSQVLGWVYAYTGNATYKTWLDRAAHVRELQNNSPFIPTWKGLGEYFGGHCMSSLYFREGGTVRGVTGAHPTTIVQPPTHAS